MTTAQWVGLGLIYLLAAAVLVWQLDKLRIQRKYGSRMAAHWHRTVQRTRDPLRALPPHERADFLAALVCARDNGDLVSTREQATAEILRFPRPR